MKTSAKHFALAVGP